MTGIWNRLALRLILRITAGHWRTRWAYKYRALAFLDPFLSISKSMRKQMRNMDFDVHELDHRIDRAIHRQTSMLIGPNIPVNMHRVGIFMSIAVEKCGGHTKLASNLASILGSKYEMGFFASRMDLCRDHAPNLLAKFKTTSGLWSGASPSGKEIAGLAMDIVRFAPRVLFVLIHMDDVYGAAVLALVKRWSSIKIVYIPHGSHYPNVGITMAHFVPATMTANAWIEFHLAHIQNVGIDCRTLAYGRINDYSRPSAERIASARARLGIPGESLCTMSGGSAYKFFEQSGESLYFELIKKLLIRNPAVHHCVISDFNSMQVAEVNRIFSDSAVRSRLHILSSTSDYEVYFCCADVFVDSIPVSGALTMIDLMRLKVPYVVKINRENALWTFHEYQRPDYAYMFETPDEMLCGIELLLKDPSVRNRIVEQNFAWFMETFEGEASARYYESLIEHADDLSCFFVEAPPKDMMNIDLVNAGSSLGGEYDVIVSLGAACSSTSALRAAGLQHLSFPFDWLYGSDLAGRTDILTSGFKNWLVKSALRRKDEISPHCDVYTNDLTGITFNHDFPEGVPLDKSFPQIRSKYARRIGRLNGLLRRAGEILFVWTDGPHLPPAGKEEVVHAYRELSAAYSGAAVSLLVFRYRADISFEQKQVRRVSRGIWEVSFDYKSHEPGARDYEVDNHLMVKCYQSLGCQVADYRTWIEKKRREAQERGVRGSDASLLVRLCATRVLKLLTCSLPYGCVRLWQRRKDAAAAIAQSRRLALRHNPIPAAVYDAWYEDEQIIPSIDTDIKVIAFHLPQFHTFPENDAWWGAGFTEWTNTRKAAPRFPGHYQPREPHADIGYYDLSDWRELKRQAEMAKRHGIYGFCFYHYWFSGKRLMEKPVDLLLRHPEIDLPFCLCWANENWTRRWDGSESEVLIAQTYEADAEQCIVDLKRYLMDPRYIRVDGKPVVMIYRPALLPDARRTFARWRKRARELGIGDIAIWVQRGHAAEKPAACEGADAEVEFPPGASCPLTYWLNDSQNMSVPSGLRHEVCAGNLLSYPELVRNMLAGKGYVENYTHPVYRCVMLGWDNAARRKKDYMCYYGYSTRMYYDWLLYNIAFTRQHHMEDRRFLFINAWNEWGEGTYLEPDKKYGYTTLNVTTRAILGRPCRELPREEGGVA